MKDYLKCVWANKFTLVGWVLLIGALLTKIFFLAAVNEEEMNPFYFLTVLGFALGVCLLALTVGGIQTLDAYQRAMYIYRRRRSISYLVSMSDEEGIYCSQVGIRLALREACAEEGRSL